MLGASTRPWPREGRTTLTSMARSPDLAAYLTTATLARTSSETAGPALLIVAIAVLGNASDGPYLAAALTGAAAVAGPVIGALLDRTDHPKRGFALSMVALGLGLAVIALLIGRAPLWVLLVVAVLAGLGYPGITGAWTAQLPRIVRPDALASAYSADAGTYSVASIIGPPVAAAFLAVSASAPLWIPVVLIALGLISLRFIRIKPHGRVVEHSLMSDLRHGLGSIVRRPSLRQTVIMTTVSFLGQAALFVTAPIITQELTGSLALTGVFFGAIAAGGIIAAALTVRRPIRDPDRVIVIGVVANAVCVLVAGLVPNFAVVLAAAFVLGLTEIPMLSATFQIRTRETTTRVRSQVFTTSSSLRTTAFAVGSAIFGAMIGLGVPVVILTGFALYVVSLLWGFAVGPRMTRRRSGHVPPPNLDA